MGQASNSFHEAPEQLKPETMDRHRAIVSLMEELEAVDWYDQRIDAARDPELRAILAHNRDEEKEHAAMVLEWLRRHDPVWDEQLRAYLFTDKPILEVEDAEEGKTQAEGSLAIGRLKERK
jgi:ferritin-like protein